jgi:hypothetical protein
MTFETLDARDTRDWISASFARSDTSAVRDRAAPASQRSEHHFRIEQTRLILRQIDAADAVIASIIWLSVAQSRGDTYDDE